LPESVLPFIVPSRYCPADQLSQLALDVVKGADPGYAQVEAIRAWIAANIKYSYGTSNASTTALDTANNRCGVCRDFAHLGIALCRALNIPARMVAGYTHELKDPDLHAWFEAYVGHRWFIFDAVVERPQGNRIAIAFGRDAGDVAIITQFGPLILRELSVRVQPALD
jgi:transglutaminase-like putative cysteine protease